MLDGKPIRFGERVTRQNLELPGLTFPELGNHFFLLRLEDVIREVDQDLIDFLKAGSEIA